MAPRHRSRCSATPTPRWRTSPCTSTTCCLSCSRTRTGQRSSLHVPVRLLSQPARRRRRRQSLIVDTATDATVPSLVTARADHREPAPVEVTLCRSPHGLVLRLRDHGGGVPREALAHIWDYAYTTVHDEDNVRSCVCAPAVACLVLLTAVPRRRDRALLRAAAPRTTRCWPCTRASACSRA